MENQLNLYKKIKEETENWRKDNYKSEVNEIREILEFQFPNSSTLRFLRKPQFEAIETYLYLRFVKNNKKTIELYKEYFPKNTELLKALGIPLNSEAINSILIDGGIDALFKKIVEDDELVKKYRLENLRESISLDYPSFIFSLVMGAGKTILIGTIIFIEFSLSLITKDNKFLKNALVFAPGKTILGALREIGDIEIDKILPKRFASILKNNLKIIYTPDKQRKISVVDRSEYNLIITNIEKIRIQSKKANESWYNYKTIKKIIDEKEKEEVINTRLRQLSTLENLAVFSDEAHHTYGSKLESGLKKVRQTIDHLAKSTSLKVVINTTGTPYFNQQILKDVVFWYGLLEGIEENILKDIRGNIYSYSEVKDENFIGEVLDDFFSEYKDVPIEGGLKAKIAIYFPQIEDAEKVKPFIEKKVLEYGLDVNAVFSVNSKSSDKDKDIFNNRINDKNLPYRVFLLVGMGTEGWNCPSLFACCLAREIKTNNFVLQSSMRCLRQIENNTKPARIYLSEKNTSILEGQLKNNYGEDLSSIRDSKNNYEERKITLIKYGDKLPEVKVKRKIKRYIKKEEVVRNIVIKKPEISEADNFRLTKYDLSKINDNRLTEKEIIIIKNNSKKNLDLYQATQELVSLYSLDYFEIFNQLKALYPVRISTLALSEIKKQIERQVDNYWVKEEEVEELLTIIKKEGFEEEVNEEGVKVYTTKIIVHREKLAALLKESKNYIKLNAGEISFHYDPYKFDSGLEVSLFEFVLEQVGEKERQNIKKFLYIGGITDRSKTDLVFEYRDRNKELRNYTPDFLLIKRDGGMIFLETKGEHLVEDFRIKESYFKTYLTDKLKYKRVTSSSSNLTQDDKKYIQEELKKK